MIPSTVRVYKFLDTKFGLKTLYERRLKVSSFEDLNDAFETRPYSTSDDRTDHAADEARQRQIAQIPLLCFSSGWSNPIMWAHYSDKHKGLCLGFDAPREWCHEIRYIETKLTAEPDSKMTAADTLFSKYIEWKYEDEVRMVAQCYHEPLKFGEELLFLDLQHDGPVKLREVIRGAKCNCSPDELNRALSFYKERVEISNAYVSPSEFKILGKSAGFMRFILSKDPIQSWNGTWTNLL